MIGKRIAILREEKGITQEQLAKDIKIERSTLSHYETGRRRPDFETLILFAKYFGVTTDYLLGNSKYKYGRLLTKEELKSFLPEAFVENHEIALTVNDNKIKIKPEVKEEIIKMLREHGYLK